MSEVVYVVGPSGIRTPLDPAMAACLVDAGHAAYVVDVAVGDVPAITPEVPSSDAAGDASATSSNEGNASEQTNVVPTPAAPAEVPAQPVAAVEAPRGNASRDEFAAYATALGIEFDAEASRDEIRALVAGKE